MSLKKDLTSYGELRSSMNLIGAYIIMGIMIIGGLVMIAFAIKERNLIKTDCKDKDEIYIIGDNQDSNCSFLNDSQCENNKTCDLIKKKDNSLSIGLGVGGVVVIGLGIGILFIMKYVNKVVHRNKTAASIYGGESIASDVDNIIN